MNYKEKYTEVTGQKPYCWTKSGQYVKSGSYSDDYVKWLEEQLSLYGVGSSNKVDYKQGFELAKKYIEESPCDPDIYKEQQEAWNKYHFWLKVNKLI